jgi:hypothetical protein
VVHGLDGCAHKLFKHGRCNSLGFDIGQNGIARRSETDGFRKALVEAEEDHRDASIVVAVEMADDGLGKVAARHQLNHTPHEAALGHALGHRVQSRLGSPSFRNEDDDFPIKGAADAETELVGVEALAKSAHRLCQRTNLVVCIHIEIVSHHCIVLCRENTRCVRVCAKECVQQKAEKGPSKST